LPAMTRPCAARRIRWSPTLVRHALGGAPAEGVAVRIDADHLVRREQRSLTIIGFVGCEAGLVLRNQISGKSSVRNERGARQLYVGDRVGGASHTIEIAQDKW
jgi:hypothetical protein